MSKISICIPTYEMNGKGLEYLEFSFNILYTQTFNNFDIVISDHSDTNDIFNLCENWKDKLKITYIKNNYKKGISSANINVAIKNAKSEIIKILFQDDFLLDSYSLETQYKDFIGNQNKWLVTACAHTSNGVNMYNPFYPKYHNDIHYGNNTISSPSVLMIKNENVLEFDENLIWLMDVEYYKRLYDNFGLPTICNHITVVNRTHENQITNTIATDKIKEKEFYYIKKKYNQ